MITWTVSKVTMTYESSSPAEQAQLCCTRDAGTPEHDVSMMYHGVVGIYLMRPLLTVLIAYPLSYPHLFISCPTKITTVSHSSHSSSIIPPAGGIFHRTLLMLTRVCPLGPPPGQGGYYPQQPQQVYQGYGGQPGYQPRLQVQPVYVYV
jgi:hypothetical protein